MALHEGSPKLFMADAMAVSIAPLLRMAGVRELTDEWLQVDLYSYEQKAVDLPRLERLQEWCRQFLAAVEAGWRPTRE